MTRWIVAVLLHVVTGLLLLISTTAPWWVSGQVKDERFHLGLWAACLQDFCMSMFDDDQVIMNVLGKGWVQTCQGCACVGLVGCTLAFFSALLYTVFYRTIGRHCCLPFISLLIFVAVCVYSYSSIVFTYQCFTRLVDGAVPSTLHLAYSSYCAGAGIITGLLSTTCYLLEYKRVSSVQIQYIPLN